MKRQTSGESRLAKHAKTSVNEYSGWTVPKADYQIERIDVAKLTPERFYEEYVAQRRPVVLNGVLLDPTYVASAKWTNEHLKAKAADAVLKVERRTSETDTFGQGKEVEMTFQEFIELVEKQDALHYLTTQDVDLDEEGRPDIMAPFMKLLSSDFPLRPKLMGNLIVQNINMWMGNNRDGSSSGLHHDYHDNLYIVLRGKKKFRLYSPADTEKMDTRGELIKVHANGRINYVGELTTAYGADLAAEAAAKAARAQEEAEKEVQLAEEAVARDEEGAQERLEKAEEMLEEAMDAALNAEMDGEADDEDDEEEDDDKNDDDEEEPQAGECKSGDKTVKNPLNFSLVDLSLNDTEMARQHPDFLSAKAAYCEVNVGQMLYLPASWFHEVQSFGSGKGDGHLALNYWFHPPDAMTTSVSAADAFAQPYTSEFWQQDWDLRNL